MSDVLDTKTRERKATASARRVVARCAALTIAAHPDPSRVGEQARFRALLKGSDEIEVSRTEPNFVALRSGQARPLSDPYLSRKPSLVLVGQRGAVALDVGDAKARVVVDGEVLSSARRFDAEELERGIVLDVDERCVLVLHVADEDEEPLPPSLGLVGESDEMRALRRDLLHVAKSDLRVLIRGETGTGKELVARALHEASDRADGPCVSVNMAAIQPSLATSALFGHKKGAFSGADADHEGCFREADGGTLFLDEIGEAEPSVQALLLRALETGEVARVGETKPKVVDVRLLAATDANLETLVADGRFREPLLHRLAEYSVCTAPLRARRADIGPLLQSFLREALASTGDESRLDGRDAAELWLSTNVVAELVQSDWPGNVRQLRNVARQLATRFRTEPRVRLTDDVRASLVRSARDPADASPASSPEPSSARGRASASGTPAELTDEAILEALEAVDWRRAAAAERLGVSRSAFYERLARGQFPKPSELSVSAVEQAIADANGDLRQAARALKVSEHGLKLRMNALGLSRA